MIPNIWNKCSKPPTRYYTILYYKTYTGIFECKHHITRSERYLICCHVWCFTPFCDICWPRRVLGVCRLSYIAYHRLSKCFQLRCTVDCELFIEVSITHRSSHGYAWLNKSACHVPCSRQGTWVLVIPPLFMVGFSALNHHSSPFITMSWITLWLFNIAMGNGPFIDGFTY